MFSRALRSDAAAVVVALAVVLLGGCGMRTLPHGGWPLPNSDLAGTRKAAGSRIDARNVAHLGVRWQFRFRGHPGFSGVFASTPIADRDTVYVQDLESNVIALVRSTGALRWTRRFAAPNDGPNGLALGGGRVYGATDSAAFALNAATGRVVWRRHLTGPTEQLVDVAPMPWNGLVFVSTIGYAPFGRGAIYGLDAATGRIRWRFVTIAHPWPHPLESGGGGLWYPVSIDARGRLYAGNSNPTPWGGTQRRPNGGAFPGPVPYTDSLLVLDARTGRLLWHDQVTPHDVRDYDFEATPIVMTLGRTNMVVGAGKGGRVVAWNRTTRRRIWTAIVGVHRNDVGPLPRHRVTVCPGLLGGVETPMAYASGRLFVPVVDLCGWGSASSRQAVKTIDLAQGRGRVVALHATDGRTLWDRRLPSPDLGCTTVSNDVVFTSTYDGSVYALDARDGAVLWHSQMRAGVNACPAVVGDLLLIGAGVADSRRARPELVAFGLR